MANYKITIPKPCNEAWEGMTPDSEGRFCGQCQKTVTDFTGMTHEQINTYMLLNSGKKVCGRFEAKQLQPEPFIPLIPKSALFNQTSFRKMFLLALFITMGTTLFSCRRQVMGEPALVDDKVQTTVVDNVTKQKEPITNKGQNPDSPVKVGKKLIPPPPKKTQVLMGDTIIVPDTLQRKK